MILERQATKRKLDLGSGGKADDAFLSFDVTTVLKPQVQGDGRCLPFKGGAFDEVRAWHVLEHIPREYLVETMNECWRVLAEGGQLDVEVPIFPSDDAMADPTHVSFFVQRTFEYFVKGSQYEEHRLLYGIRPWECVMQGRAGMNSLLKLVLRKVAE